mmetsp:Transcript_41606/g.130377  ORF Transcript_41606/g.130377 Transcript_41606/m.130377 type:complete len:226 (-) Transcript_41606:471-1148(-)
MTYSGPSGAEGADEAARRPPECGEEIRALREPDAGALPAAHLGALVEAAQGHLGQLAEPHGHSERGTQPHVDARAQCPAGAARLGAARDSHGLRAKPDRRPPPRAARATRAALGADAPVQRQAACRGRGRRAPRALPQERGQGVPCHLGALPVHGAHPHAGAGRRGLARYPAAGAGLHGEPRIGVSHATAGGGAAAVAAAEPPLGCLAHGRGRAPSEAHAQQALC